MAEPALIPQPMTFEAAARLDPDEFAGDIVMGKWVPDPRRGWRRGEVAGNAAAKLQAYAKSQRGLIVAAGRPGCMLSQDPDTLRGPDVALIRAERKPTGRGDDGWLAGAPDLAGGGVGAEETASRWAGERLESRQARGGSAWVVEGGT